jgi:hypothetical protein
MTKNRIPFLRRGQTFAGSFADTVAEAQGVKPTVPDLLLDAVAKVKAKDQPVPTLIAIDFSEVETRALAHALTNIVNPYTGNSPTGRLSVGEPNDQMKELTDKLRQSESGELRYQGTARGTFRMELPRMDSIPRIDSRVMELFRSTEGTPHLSIIEIVDGIRSPVSYPLVLKNDADSDS